MPTTIIFFIIFLCVIVFISAFRERDSNGKLKYIPHHFRNPSSPKDVEARKERDYALLIDMAGYYLYAEYKRKGLDDRLVHEEWTKKWLKKVNEAVADMTDADEHAYFNRMLIKEATLFDFENASEENRLEACHRLVRGHEAGFRLAETFIEKTTKSFSRVGASK